MFCQGAGKQSRGVLINLVAFYVFGLPASILSAFYLGWDVYGLVAGMVLGAFIQAVWYTSMVLKLDWDDEATVAVERVRQLSLVRAASIASDHEQQLSVLSMSDDAYREHGESGRTAALADLK